MNGETNEPRPKNGRGLLMYKEENGSDRDQDFETEYPVLRADTALTVIFFCRLSDIGDAETVQEPVAF